MRARTARKSIVVATALACCISTLARLPSDQKGAVESESRSASTFTPAHPGVLDAIKDFFDWRPVPVQPIAFTHKVHLSNGMECADCHASADKGPQAGIPSVTLCMTCHQAISSEKPEIKKVAAYQARGEDIPWVRVYDYSASAHVRFNHAPHIRAGVACSNCHGDMLQQTTAVRAVDLNMGYCLSCHTQRKASIDCTTCHY